MAALTPTDSLPTAEEVAIARESVIALSAILPDRSIAPQTEISAESPLAPGSTQVSPGTTGAVSQEIHLVDDNGVAHQVSVPKSALRIFVDVLTEISAGNAVSVVPRHAKLSTQEAADILNVSRPFLIKLLESGKIKFEMVGTHRRVLYQDLLSYKERTNAERRKALEELTAQAQALKLPGYD